MDSLGVPIMQSQSTGSDESTFLYHTSCPECGSSDGNSVYSDGHTYCFVCNHFDSGQPCDDSGKQKKTAMLKGKGWQFQRDNELPLVLKEGVNIFIPKGQIHRVIKGSTDLKLKIEK